MQAENPGTSCIGYGGGHTSASLDQRSYLQAEVGAWANVLLPMVNTFSTLP